MKAVIKHEFKIQNKINNLTKYMSIFLIFCTFSISLVHSHENIQVFGVIFSVISIPLAFIGLTQGFIKSDIEDGSLESSLASTEAYKIILSKYIALCICALISFVFIVPIIFVLYSIEIKQLFAVTLSGIILITLSAALSLLTSSVQGYFRTNTNFLSVLIMPLITPNIIMSGLFVQTPEDLYFITIMLGVNLVIVPPSIYLSSYLVENIYNI